MCNPKPQIAIKWPVYIFAFGEHNSKQVNVSGIQIFRAQFPALNLHKVMLNAANIYLFGIILTKWKYIYRSFLGSVCMYVQPFFLLYCIYVKTYFWNSNFEMNCLAGKFLELIKLRPGHGMYCWEGDYKGEGAIIKNMWHNRLRPRKQTIWNMRWGLPRRDGA